MNDTTAIATAPSQRTWLPFALISGVFLAVKLAVFLWMNPIGDEAYYWLWGQHPDWSYFDHPPLHAWAMAVIEAIFGWNLWSLRALTLLTFGGTLLIFWHWARRLQPDAPADYFWRATTVYLAAPLFLGMSSIVFNDHLMMFLVVASGHVMLLFAESVERDRPHYRWLYLSALLLGLAVLTKYNAVFLGFGFAIFFLVRPPLRKLYLNTHTYLAALLSVAVQAPMLWWNYTQNFASFGFHTAGRWRNTPQFAWENVLLFILVAAIVASPFVLYAAIRYCLRKPVGEFESRAHSLAVAIFLTSSISMLVLASFAEVLFYWNIVAFILLAAMGTVMIEAASRSVAHERLREAIDAVPQAMAFFDRDDRCMIWNRSYAELHAEGATLLAVGRPFRDVLAGALALGHYPEAEGRAEAWLEERLAARRAASGPVEQRTADGRWLRVEDQRTANGGTVSICVDITKLKTDAETLASARDEAEAANRAKSEFLANMSHEIRTPLNGIVGMADVLARGSLDERAAEAVRIIRDSGVTLDRLLGDILDVSRMETGEVELTPAPFHMGEALRAVAGLVEPLAATKGLRLTVDIAPGAEAVVIGDSVRLKQIVSNLLGNAVKFTDTGEVTLRAAGADGRFEVSVRDTGVGFDEAARERIFGRFKQADGSITRRFGGTGLGLAISRQLAGLMGGDLTGESSPGAGAVFTLRVDLPPGCLATPAAPSVAPARGGEGDRPLQILLVDDHPANRRVVEMMLASANVEITTAENGQLALEACADRTYDLILMDMQMPVMDGVTATRELRRLEREWGAEPAPIYMLTANAAPEQVEAGRLAGAQRHLTKPITAAKLFEALGEAAEHAVPAKAA